MIVACNKASSALGIYATTLASPVPAISKFTHGTREPGQVPDEKVLSTVPDIQLVCKSVGLNHGVHIRIFQGALKNPKARPEPQTN